MCCVSVVTNLWNLSEVRKSPQICPYNRGYFALLIPTAIVAAVLAVLRMGTGSLAHQWVVILLALLVSYALFGSVAIAYALDADDRMIARSAWSQLRGLRKLGAEA